MLYFIPDIKNQGIGFISVLSNIATFSGRIILELFLTCIIFFKVFVVYLY